MYFDNAAFYVVLSLLRSTDVKKEVRILFGPRNIPLCSEGGSCARMVMVYVDTSCISSQNQFSDCSIHSSGPGDTEK